MTDMCTEIRADYTCDREPGHGQLHHDPAGEWWMLDAVDDEERTGRKPLSGYQLVVDTLLVANPRAYIEGE